MEVERKNGGKKENSTELQKPNIEAEVFDWERVLGTGPRASVGDFRSGFSYSTLGELKKAA